MGTPGNTVGRLTVFDNGSNGLSLEWNDTNTGRHEYAGITSEDMLDYSLSEVMPFPLEIFSEEESAFFLEEYARIKKNAQCRDYYDANDNTWKNYE